MSDAIRSIGELTCYRRRSLSKLTRCSCRTGRSVPKPRSASSPTQSRDKKLGRAEALRRAMLAMIDKGKPHEPPSLLGTVRGRGGGWRWRRHPPAGR